MKLLIVLSNDYGELHDAVCLVQGCDFDSLFLFPSRMFASNQPDFPHGMRRYLSARDILASYRIHKPDVVLLFSGYLFVINRALAPNDLSYLMETWRKNRTPFATTDPFLGELTSGTEAFFSRDHPDVEKLTQHFEAMSEMYRNEWHIYHSPTPDSAVRAGSFFNPNVIRCRKDLEYIKRELTKSSYVREDIKRWLFLLSSEDFAYQVATHGHEHFVRMLCNGLEDTHRAGRQPILIAPEPCIESVDRAELNIPYLVLASSCSYLRFAQLLLEAEHVFYWNLCSASIVTRAANNLPFFVFDPGHLAKAVPRFQMLASRYYYAGQCPITIELADGLMTQRLREIALRQEEVLSVARDRYKRLPTPEELINLLLSSSSVK